MEIASKETMSMAQMVLTLSIMRISKVTRWFFTLLSKINYCSDGGAQNRQGNISGPA